MAKKVEYTKRTLLESLLRHKKQAYKTSECSTQYFKEEEIVGVKEYLDKEGIKHEMEGLILKIYWR